MKIMKILHCGILAMSICKQWVIVWEPQSCYAFPSGGEQFHHGSYVEAHHKAQRRTSCITWFGSWPERLQCISKVFKCCEWNTYTISLDFTIFQRDQQNLGLRRFFSLCPTSICPKASSSAFSKNLLAGSVKTNQALQDFWPVCTHHLFFLTGYSLNYSFRKNCLPSILFAHLLELWWCCAIVILCTLV